MARDRSASMGRHHLEDFWRGSLRGRRGFRDGPGMNSPRISRTRYNSETETIFEDRQEEEKAKLLEARQQLLEAKQRQRDEARQLEAQEQQLEVKQRQLDARLQPVEVKQQNFEGQKQQLDVKHLDVRKPQFEDQGSQLEVKQQQLEAGLQTQPVESKQLHFGPREEGQQLKENVETELQLQDEGEAEKQSDGKEVDVSD